MIAVDAMGGDFSPSVVLKGAYLAAQKDIPVKLFGPLSVVEQGLNSLDNNWKKYPLFLADAQTVVEMADEPVDAIRKKQDSSMVKAVVSVKAGECSAVVSAGNSGALMAAATFVLGRQPDVERPAIVGLLPSLKGVVVALDLGANADCKPSYLCQFGKLGDAHARRVLGISNPRIALLSNGAEEGKGSSLIKETYALLAKTDLNFIGNIEPHDIVMHKADVVISDGFSGNVLLKTMEAMHVFFKTLLKESLGKVTRSLIQDEQKQALVSHYSQTLMYEIAGHLSKVDQGGALLMGVNGIVVVAHGSADEHDIQKAIMLAHKVAHAEK